MLLGAMLVCEVNIVSTHFYALSEFSYYTPRVIQYVGVHVTGLAVTALETKYTNRRQDHFTRYYQFTCEMAPV